jgi:hypothetical protein
MALERRIESGWGRSKEFTFVLLLRCNMLIARVDLHLTATLIDIALYKQLGDSESRLLTVSRDVNWIYLAHIVVNFFVRRLHEPWHTSAVTHTASRAAYWLIVLWLALSNGVRSSKTCARKVPKPAHAENEPCVKPLKETGLQVVYVVL